jgi:AcrR family transcriptional regulator
MRDHRVEVAEKKRLLMRARLVDAAMRVFADQTARPPIIDDVIREAKVSRGTFYNYFDSLDDVLSLIGQDVSNQMTTEILPVYDVLVEPWQRFSVGFRFFLTRAMLDRKWAGFVTGTNAWAKDTLVNQYMSADLKNGKAAGQFTFADLQAATDFLKGASAHGILALRQGVEDPISYIDASVHMAMVSLGCNHEFANNGVQFSSDRLKAWMRGELSAGRPQWARNTTPKEARLLANS